MGTNTGRVNIGAFDLCFIPATIVSSLHSGALPEVQTRILTTSVAGHEAFFEQKTPEKQLQWSPADVPGSDSRFTSYYLH